MRTLIIFFLTCACSFGGVLDRPGMIPNQVTNIFEGMRNVYGNTPASLQKWRLAVTKVRDGVGDAKLFCVGDSTTFGAGGGSDPRVLSSYPWKVSELISQASPGLAVANIADNTRWSFGAGWATGPGGFGFAQTYLRGASGSGDLVFNPAFKCDAFDVYYIAGTDSDYGTLTVTPLNGSVVSTNTKEASGSIKKLTVTCSFLATNTIRISGSGGKIDIIGVEPYLSASRQIRVGNGGVSGSTASMWATDTSVYTSIGTIKAYAPDLTVLMLGINDAGGAIDPLIFKTNIVKIVTAAKVSGDVVLMSMVPSSTISYATNEVRYQPIFRDIAKEQNIPLIDLYGRFGGVWVGGFMYDALHPNGAGYWDIANCVSSFVKETLTDREKEKQNLDVESVKTVSLTVSNAQVGTITATNAAVTNLTAGTLAATNANLGTLTVGGSPFLGPVYSGLAYWNKYAVETGWRVDFPTPMPSTNYTIFLQPYRTKFPCYPGQSGWTAGLMSTNIYVHFRSENYFTFGPASTETLNNAEFWVAWQICLTNGVTAVIGGN